MKEIDNYLHIRQIKMYTARLRLKKKYVFNLDV